MLKLSSSRGIKIDVPVLSVSWSFEDHSVIIQALRKGPIEHEASDTGGVPRWKSSCPDRLAEATSLALVLSTFFLLFVPGTICVFSLCFFVFWYDGFTGRVLTSFQAHWNGWNGWNGIFLDWLL